MKETYFVLDFETTGLSPEMERVIEVGAAKIVAGRVVETFQSLIHPQRRISSQITAITGITNSMVAKAPLAGDVFPQLAKFLGSAPIVAHNASFDSRFFLAEMNRCRIKSKNPFLCTLLLSRRVFPDLSSYKLETLCYYLSIKRENAHRALADVLMTAQVFGEICSRVKKMIYGEHLEYEFLNKLSSIQKKEIKSFLEKYKK